MMVRSVLFRCIVLLLLFSWANALRADRPGELGPLAQYVAKPDASYGWQKVREGRAGAAEYVELILTSQTWREIVWKHRLFILKPASVDPAASHALLFISGGGWKPEFEKPSGELEMTREARVFAALAEQLKTPVAVLLHVPHQPIFDGKVEDQIIAYTFDEFMKTGDPEWPLLLPMVKSAVKGMDAVQEFAARNWALNIKSFTVSGASKRGWTTWLTGAVDSRAAAIAPMVIDVLNMREQMRHQKATWGKPSDEIREYSERGLTERLESNEATTLRSIIDPYYYRERLTQPKLIIIGTNDRYWPLDALNLYWDDLKGSKYVMYVPNNGHDLKDLGRLSGGLAALHQHIATGRPLPKLHWEFTEQNGKLALKIESDLPPLQVNTWTASAPTRDFRDAKWTSQPAKDQDNSFICELEKPASGYAALFGELMFEGQPLPYFLSSNVKIISAGATAAGE